MRSLRGVVFISVLLWAQAAAQVPNGGRSASMAEEQDYAFAYGLYSDGLYQLAAEQFEQFLRKYPSSMKRLDAFYLSVECRFQQQQFDTAAKLFGRFLSEYPDSRLSDDALLRLGEAHIRVGKPDLALPYLKRILDEFPDGGLAADAAYWTGEAFVRLGEYENGIKYFLMAVEHYPDSRVRDYALYAVGWAYQTKKEYPKAIEWYRKLPAQFPSSDLIPASKVRIGECYFGMREYRQAIRELSVSRAGIVRDAELGEALYLIAESHYQLAEYDEARKAYETTLATVPDHRLTPDVIYALGWTYLKLNNFSMAEATFDRIASGSEPLATSALLRRGVAERLGGKADAALRSWSEVLRRDPKGPNADNALYETGLVLYEADSISAAQSLFERVIREFPDSDVRADAYRMLGECLVIRSEFRKAQEAFAAAVSLADASFEARTNALYQLGWSAFKVGEYRAATEAFTQFLEQYPEHPKAAEARHWRGESFYRMNDYTAAVRDFDAVGGSSPRREEALYGAGYALFKQGNYDGAAQRLNRLLTEFPSGKFTFDARVRLADCYFFQKDYKGAEAAYRTVIRQFSERADRDYAMYQLGQSYFRLGNLDDALRQFQGIQTDLPSSSLADDAQYAIGWLWFQGKNYDEAIREFRVLLQKYPESDLGARTLYSIGDAYYNQQNYPAAEQSYRDVLRRYPKSSYVADAISGIQYCLLAQGKQEQALAVIDAFVRENPGSADAQGLLLKKGDLLFSQKQYDAAVREYRGFAERYAESPLRANAWFWIGRSYEMLGRMLDAASAFDRAAAIPNATVRIRAEASFQSGEAYRALKSYEKAAEAYQQAVTAGKGTTIASDAAFRLGTVSEERGDIADALQKYNGVIAAHPGTEASDRAKLALARIYIRETNYAEAEALATQVATTRTDRIGAEAQYLIGLQFAQQGDWANAIPAYLRVRYIFPSHEEWLAHAALGLGEAYEATDDFARAREAYQSVMRMEQQKDAAAEAQRRLKRMKP